ncbi:MAG TPA: hypothetical protein VI306_24140, partial [Pyrinomonadaceae bacterium]
CCDEWLCLSVSWWVKNYGTKGVAQVVVRALTEGHSHSSQQTAKPVQLSFAKAIISDEERPVLSSTAHLPSPN